MTKPELIDAVKRWQVAEYLTYTDLYQSYLWEWYYNFLPFIKTTNALLALLEQLEEEPDDYPSTLFQDIGSLGPFWLFKPGEPGPSPKYQWMEVWKESEKKAEEKLRELFPTTPGVGFGG